MGRIEEAARRIAIVPLAAAAGAWIGFCFSAMLIGGMARDARLPDAAIDAIWFGIVCGACTFGVAAHRWLCGKPCSCGRVK